MIGFGYTKPSDEFITDLAENMRAVDKAEVWATRHLEPEVAVRYSLGLSEQHVWVMNDDRDAVCAFGVSRHPEEMDWGIPWLLATDLMEQYPLMIMKQGRQFSESWLLDFEKLVNVVHDKNETSKRWLERLGFTLGEPFQHGVDQELFRVFTMERENA